MQAWRGFTPRAGFFALGGRDAGQPLGPRAQRWTVLPYIHTVWARQDSRWARGSYRRFFFLRGGGGGALAALTSATVATGGAGQKALTTYCWPIVQMLVVIQ